MEYIENSAPLKEIINTIHHEQQENINKFRNLINKIIDELQNYISIMYTNDIIHWDLNLSNILLQINNKNNVNENGKNLILRYNNIFNSFWIK